MKKNLFTRGSACLSGHGFSRAAKLLKMDNSTLSKASAQRSRAPEKNVFRRYKRGLCAHPNFLISYFAVKRAVCSAGALETLTADCSCNCGSGSVPSSQARIWGMISRVAASPMATISGER